MGELPTNVEGDRSFTAFFGTTVENFLTCAITTDDRVYFDKSREPMHIEPDATQYLHSATGAVYHARLNGKKLGHKPAVLEGLLDERFEYAQELPKGSIFPVTRIYIPREGQEWDNYKLMHDGVAFNRVYEQRDAAELLRELKEEST